MKFIAFCAGLSLAGLGLLSATAQPRIDAAYERRLAYECQRLGPLASNILVKCANY